MKSVLFFVLAAFSSMSFAVDIASCSNPVGKAYYPEIGLVPKDKSGWEEDEKIINGLIKLSKISNDKYDILFVDSTKQITSSVEDGGTVLMLSRGAKSVSFLVLYPGSTAEIFTFLVNNSGVPEYMHVTSRAGDNVLITKASVMRGDCAFIDFTKL